jgi:hypothetical protein
LSECNGYKYLGKINRSDQYILQRHCVEHSQLGNRPHRDEATVTLTRVIPLPAYSRLIQNGSLSKTIDVHQQGTGTQQLKGRETAIPSGKAYPRMVPRISR